MRAAIYARLSRDRTGLSTSIVDQVRECEALCAERGWEFELYRDSDVPAGEAQSQRRKPRPEYGRMLDDLRAGRVGVVVCWATDRLYRHPRDLEDILDMADAGRVEVHALHSGLIDLSTPTGRMVARISAAVNKREVEETGERIVRKHESLARGGRGHGGPRAFGLRDAENLDEREAEAAREAAARILNGEGLRTVCRILNRQGFRTSFGNEWSAKSLRTSLISRRMVGDLERNGVVVGKTAHPPILGRATWNALRAEFARRADRAAPRSTDKYLATGLLVCSTCGGALSGMPSRGVRGYYCHHDAEHGPGGRPRINAEALEEWLVTEALGREVGRPASAPDPASVEERLRDAIDGVQARLDDLARARFADGTIDDSQFMAAQEPLRARLEQLEAEAAAAAVPPRPPGRYSHIREWLDRGAPSPHDDPEYRALLESMVERVVVRPAGRNPHLAPADRCEVAWREGVRERRD